MRLALGLDGNKHESVCTHSSFEAIKIYWQSESDALSQSCAKFSSAWARSSRALTDGKGKHSTCHLRMKEIRAITLHLIKHIHIHGFTCRCGEGAGERACMLYLSFIGATFFNHTIFCAAIQVIGKTVVVLVFRWSHRIFASQTHIILLWQGTLVVFARNRQKCLSKSFPRVCAPHHRQI